MTIPAFTRIVRVSAVNPLAVPNFAKTQGDFNRRFAGAVNSLAQSNGSGNVGDTKEIAGSTLPPGWLYCDGSAISRVSFPALFAEIGIKWGAGDGLTTFNLPPAGIAVVATVPPTQTIGTGGTVAVAGVVAPVAPPAGTTGGSGDNIATGGRVAFGDGLYRIV